MDEEILNIEHHKRRLVLKALNKYLTVRAAAAALGISWRQLYRLIRDYDIVCIGNIYQFKVKVHSNIITQLSVHYDTKSNRRRKRLVG